MEPPAVRCPFPRGPGLGGCSQEQVSVSWMTSPVPYSMEHFWGLLEGKQMQVLSAVVLQACPRHPSSSQRRGGWQTSTMGFGVPSISQPLLQSRAVFSVRQISSSRQLQAAPAPLPGSGNGRLLSRDRRGAVELGHGATPEVQPGEGLLLQAPSSRGASHPGKPAQLHLGDPRVPWERRAHRDGTSGSGEAGAAPPQRRPKALVCCGECGAQRGRSSGKTQCCASSAPRGAVPRTRGRPRPPGWEPSPGHRGQLLAGAARHQPVCHINFFY